MTVEIECYLVYCIYNKDKKCVADSIIIRGERECKMFEPDKEMIEKAKRKEGIVCIKCGSTSINYRETNKFISFECNKCEWKFRRNN